MVFRKHAAARLLNFLFLIPFILAYRPLLVRFSSSDIIWFSIGTLLIFIIIIVSNRLPYLSLIDDRLILNLHYYQKPEIHDLERITLVEVINYHVCRIHSRDFKPVRISLNPQDQKKFLNNLAERNINIKEI